jgi:hypothetical protein
MYERVATLLVGALYLYNIAGLVFAIAFVITGVKRIDSQAIGSGVGFRVLIFPGAAALWPLLLRRWISRTAEPPEERKSAPMIQPLRKIHRRIFIVLALLLPALFLSGIVFRYSWPTPNQSGNPSARPLPSGATP